MFTLFRDWNVMSCYSRQLLFVIQQRRACILESHSSARMITLTFKGNESQCIQV
jgi:hypothetical protein